MKTYIFKILTVHGEVMGSSSSIYSFDGAPFGYVDYLQKGSSVCEENVLTDFWDCIDDVLQQNEISPQEFVRVISAVDENNTHYGEIS